MSIFQRIALLFRIIGALNWRLVGFFGFTLVSALFGVNTAIERIIYNICRYHWYCQFRTTLPFHKRITTKPPYLKIQGGYFMMLYFREDSAIHSPNLCCNVRKPPDVGFGICKVV
jgi:Domain of unknown function (DUF378)